MSPVLQVEDLAVTFGGGTAAVRGASFTVEKGETHCIVGESGCGKSVTALAVLVLGINLVGDGLRNLLGTERLR